MLFGKGKKVKEEVEVRAEKPDLYPIVHVADSLKDYQRQLVSKEVSSLQELREIERAFDKVLEENSVLREKLGAFHGRFEDVGEISGRYDAVKTDIMGSVEEWAARQFRAGAEPFRGDPGYLYGFPEFCSEDQRLHEPDHRHCQPDQYAGAECLY